MKKCGISPLHAWPRADLFMEGRCGKRVGTRVGGGQVNITLTGEVKAAACGAA